MEAPLLEELDKLVEHRKTTRSKLLGDLVRTELMATKLAPNTHGVMTLTLVYDHHVRELSRKLTSMQHDLGDKVRSTLHVHLSHDECLEVIVIEGRARELQDVAKRLLATKGVRHGGAELVTDIGGSSVRHQHV